MDPKEIHKEFHRITKRSFFKPERIVREKEVAIAKRAAQITRRHRASRIIGGKTKDGKEYILLKFRNDMI